MLYDKGESRFLMKETLLNLNFDSGVNSCQPKNLGKMTINLAEVANEGIYG